MEAYVTGKGHTMKKLDLYYANCHKCANTTARPTSFCLPTCNRVAPAWGAR